MLCVCSRAHYACTVCVCVCVCVIRTHTKYTLKQIFINIQTHAYTHAHTRAHTHTHIYTHVYIHIHITHIHTHIHVHVHVHVARELGLFCHRTRALFLRLERTSGAGGWKHRILYGTGRYG